MLMRRGRPQTTRLAPQVRLAYLIRAHHAPAQLARLVRRLDTGNATFFVHVNARTDDAVYGAIAGALSGIESVRWVPRQPVYYAGFSLVRATLAGVEELVRADPPVDYALLLSGQDYPLRPAEEIEAFLEEHAGSNFLHHYALPASAWADEDGGLRRIRYVWFERARLRTRLLRLPLLRRRLPAGLEPYGGSAFWCLTRECLEHVQRFTRERPDVVRFFRHTLIPDELFFQTVIMNSPLRDTVVNDDLRYVHWLQGARPKTLVEEDFDDLAACGKLFARKFDAEESVAVLDRLDREVLRAA